MLSSLQNTVSTLCRQSENLEQNAWGNLRNMAKFLRDTLGASDGIPSHPEKVTILQLSLYHGNWTELWQYEPLSEDFPSELTET